MRIHSKVGLTTNSSSETFMFVNKDNFGVERLKKFINAVLHAGGSDETADSLFEFELVPTWSHLDSIKEYAVTEGNLDDVMANHWLLGEYPDGIHNVKITPRAGINAPDDLGSVLQSVFTAEEIGNEW